MASSGCDGAATATHPRALLPFTCDSLRIPDELAEEIAVEEALVAGPAGKIWRVEVGWDGDGAFLGRGWPAFAAACGARAGWLLVLHHRGRGVLTVKAFDDTRCLTELGAQTAAPAVEATTNYKGASRKPQFISVFPTKSMGKLIPARFVQNYIPKEHLNNHMTIVSGSLGKVCPIELEINRSNVFFAGGWSQFMAFHGITEADALLLRYEGNMVFTVKVFGPDGCQRESMHKDGRMQRNEQGITLTDTERQQDIPFASSKKCKSKNNSPSADVQRRQKGSVISSKKSNKSSKANCAYDLGPPAWLTKKMNASMMTKHHLSLPRHFCNAIGFQKPCMITLQDSMGGTRSWQVRGLHYNNGSCQLGSGWKKVCQDIGLKFGDVITLKIIKTTLWDVIVART
ncbi:unnamed protein product [Urochloa decumbens]|uniref:TF-B3 domain-containing protein n=1 Tax=Urochloa decumbens TaxID=240449 RepID=A0ABC9CCB1_9POAL